ncbi:MAG: transposase [Rhodanobacter sp.]
MSKRRKFSDEFKREAVGLSRQRGAQVSQVARDIGVGAAALGYCRQLASHLNRHHLTRRP